MFQAWLCMASEEREVGMPPPPCGHLPQLQTTARVRGGYVLALGSVRPEVVISAVPLGFV